MLVACPNASCGKWMHEECLKHSILLKVWEELGADKPYKPKEPSSDKQADGAKRPLSPDEPNSATVAAQLPIQVKTDTENNETKATDASVDVKEESVSGQTPNGRALTIKITATDAPRKGAGGKRSKKVDDLTYKPYEGHFDAIFKPEIDKYEIEDLRKGVEDGQKTWLEEVHCLMCGACMD